MISLDSKSAPTPCLDREELDDRVEGSQQVVRGKVEQEQGVQGQRDGHVVDEGGVQVALAGGPVAVVVQVESLTKRSARINISEFKYQDLT